MAFRLATVQFQPDKGKLSQNLDKMAEAIRQAAEEGADLVLFPESAPTGYILEGGVEELSLTPQALTEELTKRLNNLPRALDVATGFYERTDGQSYNSSAYMLFNEQGGTLHNVYRKLFLPTYHVFDEQRFHQPGDELGIVETRLGKLGILICEDVWHSILGSLLATAGVHTVLVHAASPARGFSGEKPSNILQYERIVPALSAEHGVFAAMAMLTGFEGGKGFVGGSMVVSPFGEKLVQAQSYGDEILISEIDPEDVRLARQHNPLANDLQRRWTLIQKLVNQIDPD